MAVLVRHAARLYDRSRPDREPFLPLTEQGKQDALALGMGLPASPWYHFFSSPYGRCIETAYQIEKGCLAQGARTRVNQVAPHLAPFFFVDAKDIGRRIRAEGPERVFQEWLRGVLPVETILPPRQALRSLLEPIVARLDADRGSRIDVLVTHDAHVYLVRDGCLGQSIEAVGPAGFLEGIVLYRQAGTVQAANQYTSQPVRLPEEPSS